MKSTIHDRISEIVEHFGNGKNTVIASKLGVSEGNIRGYVKNVMPKHDFLEKIVRCFDVDSTWLLTGIGTMLKEDSNSIQTTKESTPSELPATSDDASADTPGTAHAPEAVAVSISQKEKQTMKPIPLVTETAAAGFGNCDFAIAEQDVKDYYVIPKFHDRNIRTIHAPSFQSRRHHSLHHPHRSKVPSVEQVPRHCHSRARHSCQTSYAKQAEKLPHCHIRQQGLPSIRYSAG